jgi:hypothetical protein
MPLDPKIDPLASLEARRDELVSRKRDLEARRAELTYQSATGDKAAGKALTELRAESERLLIELTDTVQAVEIAKDRAEASRLNAAKERAQAAARDAVQALDRADAAADALGKAALSLNAAAHQFISARRAARAAVEVMAGACAEAQIPTDPNQLHRVTRLALPQVAAVEFVRDCYLTALFEDGAFGALGAAGGVMIDWSEQRDAAQIGKRAHSLNDELRAAIAAYL